MIKYIIKRILYLIPILLGVSFIVFALLFITPGDPARNALGASASEQAVMELRKKWGLMTRLQNNIQDMLQKL